jgi:hypothetical protein
LSGDRITVNQKSVIEHSAERNDIPLVQQSFQCGPQENSASNPQGDDRTNHNTTYSQAPDLQLNTDFALEPSTQAWSETTYIPSAEVASNGSHGANITTAAEGTARYVHFDSQVPIASQEHTSATVLPNEFNLDFASLGQNDQSSHMQNFYDQEGLSNLFPGFNMVRGLTSESNRIGSLLTISSPMIPFLRIILCKRTRFAIYQYTTLKTRLILRSFRSRICFPTQLLLKKIQDHTYRQTTPPAFK